MRKSPGVVAPGLRRVVLFVRARSAGFVPAEFVRGKRHLKTSAVVARLGFGIADFLAQHGGVVPTEAELWIGSVAAQGPECFRAVGVIEQEDVTLFAFDQCQYIYILRHVGGSPRLQTPGAAAPREVGWVGGS